MQTSALIHNLLDGKNRTVVAYGTSLTAEGKWVADTREWLNGINPGVATATLHNAGMSGRASRSGLSSLETSVIARRPDTVLIEFAMNDAFTAYDDDDEIAFYDALAERPEVLKTMGDATLKQLATELTEQLRSSTTVDWQVRDSVRAKMRILIKRLLKKYKYPPPESQEEAVDLVLKQAESLADDW